MMSKKLVFILVILFFIFLFAISVFYLKANVEKLNVQVEQNIERNLSINWGSKEPKLFAEDYSSDISNLSLNIDKLIIEIPIHQKSHILNFTQRIIFDECIFQISLIHLLLDLRCRKFTADAKELIFDQKKKLFYSRNFYFDSDIFQRLFTRFRFLDLKFHFKEVSINNDVTQNINGQLEFHNDKNATLKIEDRLFEFFNRPEGLEIHHQNQKFFFLNKSFFQHFWN
jgi:hypothetical protein